MDTRTRQPQMARRRARRHHRDPRAARQAPLSAAPSATGIQDHALYACGCGHSFSAGVSTSVDCPRCGAGQAW